MSEQERRFIPISEMRAVEGKNGALLIEGYPIVYDSPADIWPGFRETIQKGAAAAALTRSNEFVLWDHNSGQPMARRGNATLEVKEDDHGVFIRADVSKTIWGREGYESIKNGVTDKMSFAFTVTPIGETWSRIKEGEKIIDLRTITEFDQIYDYSPVTYPAYEQTELVARSKDLAVRNKPKLETSDGGDPTGEVLEAQVLNLEIERLGG